MRILATVPAVWCPSAEDTESTIIVDCDCPPFDPFALLGQPVAPTEPVEAEDAEYAEAELAATRLGLRQLTLTANLNAAPRVNLDWWMGDDIDVSLTCDRFPAGVDSDGLETAGFEARLRTVGWDMDPDARTIKPRIMEAGA